MTQQRFSWPGITCYVVFLWNELHKPVMFPIEASAPISCNAALRLAKVSGKLVPIAMMVIPLTLFLRPATQPNSLPSCESEQL